jgi:hypothetical protein
MSRPTAKDQSLTTCTQAAEELGEAAFGRMQAAVRAAILERCHGLFAAYPRLHALGWNQVYALVRYEGEVNFSEEWFGGPAHFNHYHRSVVVQERWETVMRDAVVGFLEAFGRAPGCDWLPALPCLEALFGSDVEVTVSRRGAVRTTRLGVRLSQRAKSTDSAGLLAAQDTYLFRPSEEALAGGGMTNPLAQAFREKVLLAARGAFLDGCRMLFEAHRGLDSFGWRHGWDSWLDDGFVESEFWSTVAYPTVNNRDPHRATGAEAVLQQAVATFLQAFDGNDLLLLFGEEFEGTVYRDGTVKAGPAKRGPC